MIGVSIITFCLLVLTILVLRGLYRRWGKLALGIGVTVVCLGCLVLVGVISKEKYRHAEIRTNMYDGFNADSINNIFAEYDLPLHFTDYNLSICDKYLLCVDTVDWGETIEVISTMNSMYVIYVSEYIVGYDLWFFYDLETNQLYQTEPILKDDYRLLYATLDISKQSIHVQCEEANIEERVNLILCEKDTIRL